MVLSAVSHDSCNMIAALADGKFTVWYYPNAVFVDKDLLSAVVFDKGISGLFIIFAGSLIKTTASHSICS